MRLVRGGNYSWPRVGYARPLAPREEVPFAFVEDGTVMVDVGPRDIRYTPAERAAGRARVTRVKFPGYPIRIVEDTVFMGVRFYQRAPHTDIFQVSPGVTVSFIPNGDDHCNLINVTVPDGAIVKGGNLAQVIPVETGNPKYPYQNTLCSCERCCVVRPVIQEILLYGNRGAFRDEKGCWLHHEMKPHYAARRLDADLCSQHKAQIEEENAAAVQRAATKLQESR